MKWHFTVLVLLAIGATAPGCLRQASGNTGRETADRPPHPQPGKCYAKCVSPDGSGKQWCEVLCQQKLTKKFIRELQTKLDEAGYSTPLDGVLGAQTKAALSHYQMNSKLPIGNLDLQTLDALDIKP